jgi:hypothetical protein
MSVLLKPNKSCTQVMNLETPNKSYSDTKKVYHAPTHTCMHRERDREREREKKDR